MLGEAISMLVPQVVGFKLMGALPEGATATDLVLTVTQILRETGVVGKFVEYYGHGLDEPPARRPRDHREHVPGVRGDVRLLPGRRRDDPLPAPDRAARTSGSRSSRRTARRTGSGTTRTSRRRTRRSSSSTSRPSSRRSPARAVRRTACRCARRRRRSSRRSRRSASTTGTRTTRRSRRASPPATRPHRHRARARASEADAAVSAAPDRGRGDVRRRAW